MSHEQSETVQGPDGKWYLTYGSQTGVPGRQLPGTPAFPSPQAAEPMAVARSRGSASDAERPFNIQRAWERVAGNPDLRMEQLSRPVIPPPPDFSQVPPPPTEKPMGSMGIPADIQARVERPFGLPKMPVAPASLAVPGASSLLGRVGLQGLAGGAEALASGKGPLQAVKDAGAGAAGGLVGEGVSAGVKSLVSPLLKRTADSKVAGELASYLSDKVPAWKGMKNLGQMLYSQRGYNRLHEAYDQSLKDVITKGAGKEIVVPEDVARKLGVGMKGMVASKVTAGQGMPNSVAVDAGELAQKMTGKWKGAFAGAYRAAANALDSAGIGDPEARGAYKVAMGVQNYLNSAKALGKSGRDFDLMAAQSKLGDKKVVDELRRRGMGDVIDILLPEGQKAITKGTQKVPGAILGVLSGMAGGHGAGLPGIGLGGAGGEFIGQRLGQMLPKYGNLPATPAANAITQLLSRLGGTAGTKGPLAP